jgi:hypothetical protein
MKGLITIFFNDTVIAVTDKPVTYQRETDSQTEYRITDIKRSLTASFYSEKKITFVQNDNFLFEVL